MIQWIFLQLSVKASTIASGIRVSDFDGFRIGLNSDNMSYDLLPATDNTKMDHLNMLYSELYSGLTSIKLLKSTPFNEKIKNKVKYFNLENINSAQKILNQMYIGHIQDKNNSKNLLTISDNNENTNSNENSNGESSDQNVQNAYTNKIINYE